MLIYSHKDHTGSISIGLQSLAEEMKIVEQVTTYIKKHNIAISISVVKINTIEPLWELYIAELLSKLGIHQKAHGFSHSLAVVDVVITIQVQHEGCIGKNR